MNPLRLCQLSLGLLVMLLVLWHGLLGGETRAVRLSLAFAPLLPFLAAWVFGLQGLWVYGGIAALVYFCHGVMELMVDPLVRGPALAEIALSLVYFTGLHLRTRALRHQRRSTS